MDNKRCKYYINKGCSCNNDEDDLGECAYKDGIKIDNACMICDYFKPIGSGDNVSYPVHYTRGKIQVMDFIEDQGLHKNLHRAAALQYLCRAGYKEGVSTKQDLEKAIWYINREIKILEDVENKSK